MSRKVHKIEHQEQASGPTLVAEGVAPETPVPVAAPELRVRFRLSELGTVLEQGRSRIDQLDAALEKLAASALTVTEIGRRVEALRTDGRKRLDQLRADALKRVDGAPGALLSAAAGAARTSLRSLSHELHAMAQRLEGAGTRKDEASPHAPN